MPGIFLPLNLLMYPTSSLCISDRPITLSIVVGTSKNSIR